MTHPADWEEPEIPTEAEVEHDAPHPSTDDPWEEDQGPKTV